MADRKPWEMTDELPEKKEDFRAQAAVLQKSLLGVIEQVLLKHTAAVLEEMHAQITSRDREIAELRRLVYVPGVWKCAKCSLRLVSSNLHADSGKISANNDPQPCANGCGPMWRVTERDAGNDLCDRLDKSATEIVELRERLERAQAALKWIEKHSTLHTSVDILYVIDGYQVRVTHEGSYTPNGRSFQGETVEEACALAIRDAEEGKNV